MVQDLSVCFSYFSNSLHFFFRLAYTLSKYLSVDVYGECGDLDCPRLFQDACYKMLEREYKFYLSFENSLCRDYVTEKFFGILQ